jgi:hypothetical protein
VEEFICYEVYGAVYVFFDAEGEGEGSGGFGADGEGDVLEVAGGVDYVFACFAGGVVSSGMGR